MGPRLLSCRRTELDRSRAGAPSWAEPLLLLGVGGGGLKASGKREGGSRNLDQICLGVLLLAARLPPPLKSEVESVATQLCPTL